MTTTLYIARTNDRSRCWLGRDGGLVWHPESAARHEFEWQAAGALQRHLWDNGRDPSEGEVVVIEGLAAETWALADRVRASGDDGLANVLDEIGSALRFTPHSDDRIAAMSLLPDSAMSAYEDAQCDAQQLTAKQAEQARDNLGDSDPSVVAGARAFLAEYDCDQRGL